MAVGELCGRPLLLPGAPSCFPRLHVVPLGKSNELTQWTSQTMDVIDGKQARATGTSSPMGELFDHGCDALNSAFTSPFSLLLTGRC